MNPSTVQQAARPRLRTLLGLPDRPGPVLILAPMAGYTAAPLRRLCHLQGADLCYTEMTNDLGLLHDAARTWRLLETFPGEGPVVAHLYGSDPASLAEAAARAEASGRFAAIDLNAGCPVHKVTANGAGAALLRDPRRIYAILSAMRRAVRLPLTVKTRLGPSPDRPNALEALAAAEDAGADAFALHARFTSQGHGGAPRLDLLAEVKSRARIPVIGNGGVCSPLDAWRLLHETGADGVMVARAAIGNPWIFRDLRAALDAGGDAPPPPSRARPRRDLAEIRDMLEAHLADESALLRACSAREGLPPDGPEAQESLATTFRCHLFRYLHGLKGSSYLRGHLHTLRTLADIRAAVAACLEREAAYRASAPSATSSAHSPL